MQPRYAIYFAPATSHPLHARVAALLGHDASADCDVSFPDVAPFNTADWPGFTEEPRRYGFHATLKAPMELAASATEADLIAAAAAFAAPRHSFDLELDLAELKGFLALVPTGDRTDINSLAADCVRDFDCLRAPLSAADRERRLKSPLTPVEVERMDRWGYPYVFDGFRFHMTLTGRLSPEQSATIRQALTAWLQPLPLTLPIDAIAIFKQHRRDGRFCLLRRFEFGQ